MRSSRLRNALSKIDEVKQFKASEAYVVYQCEHNGKMVSWREIFGDVIQGLPHCFEVAETKGCSEGEPYGWHSTKIEEIVEWMKK